MCKHAKPSRSDILVVHVHRSSSGATLEQIDSSDKDVLPVAIPRAETSQQLKQTESDRSDTAVGLQGSDDPLAEPPTNVQTAFSSKQLPGQSDRHSNELSRDQSVGPTSVDWDVQEQNANGPISLSDLSIADRLEALHSSAAATAASGPIASRTSSASADEERASPSVSSANYADIGGDPKSQLPK